MDSQIALQQPILDGGIRSINFFNGRLLSARDLTREQSAYREADRRLGQAVGEGIAYGLEVSKSLNSTEAAPVVTVESGLAVNRTGQTLMLSAKTEIALVRRASTAGGTVQPFGDCLPLQTGTYIAGAGVYLLTLAPAQSTEGRAITNGLNSGAASCNTDTMVTAVQFRLIQLDQQITAGEMLDQNHLRNLIAYKCFGVSETSAFVGDPFGAELQQWGLLDSLRPNQLTECEVPLAILYWTLEGGLKFIDMWSVRRRVTQRPSVGRWAAGIHDRRAREGEAMFLQFQNQLEALAAQVNPQTLVAKQHFKFLPPVGVLPHEDTLSGSGFDYQVFFDGVTYREPVFIEGARAEHLFRRSQTYPPTDLDTGEMVWLYWVAQNMISIEKNPVEPARAYLIFTNGHVPYQGQAQYDLAHWDYGNYAI